MEWRSEHTAAINFFIFIILYPFKAGSTEYILISTYDLMIYQSGNYEGLKKQTTINQNIVADDLTYNNSTYDEMISETLALGWFEEIQLEETLWANFVILFTVSGRISGDGMDDVLVDMINEMRYRNKQNIGKSVDWDGPYNSSDYNRYSNTTLTQKSVTYSSFVKYVDDVKYIVMNKLSKSKGELGSLGSASSGVGEIYEAVKKGKIHSPVFLDDPALILAIHDFQGHNITISDYKCDGNTFSGTIKFHFYDHFGLDSDDYEWAPVFCDWYTLQHYDKFDGRYMPFITMIDHEVKFSGEIE